MLAQKTVAIAASLIWQCGTFHRTGRSNGPLLVASRPEMQKGANKMPTPFFVLKRKIW
jgi:hypothetical protein